MGKQQLIIFPSSSSAQPKQYGMKKFISKKESFAQPLNRKKFQKLEMVAKELEEIYLSMICSNQSFTCLSTKGSIESFDKCSEDNNKCLSIEDDEDDDEEIYSSFDLE